MTHQPDISDDAVLKATGRSWSEWNSLLGGEGKAQSTHEEIVKSLREEHGAPSWWQESIATAFEQSIGRVSGDETDDGFQIEVSRALDLPAETVLQAWIDGELRGRWIRRGDFEPSTVKTPGTVRGKWMPDNSWIDVEVAETGAGKCQLDIGHRKLGSAETAERMRHFWMQSIDRLVERIAGTR